MLMKTINDTNILLLNKDLVK